MKRIFAYSAISLSLLLSVAGCKKNDVINNSNTDLTSEVTQHSDDQTMASLEEESVSDDVNQAIENDNLFSGRNTSLICGATIVRDSSATTKGLTITFNDTTNCSGTRKRSGVIKISMARTARWRDSGTVINFSFQDLKITRLRDNKSVTINGDKTVTNEHGGLVRLATQARPVSLLIQSNNMTATYDNGSQREWKVAKRRVYSREAGMLVISTSGTGVNGSMSNIAYWGTNRNGNSFTTQIIDPLTLRQSCDFRLTNGKVIHTISSTPITVTFGLDQNGAPAGCPGANFYYLKAEWTNAQGQTKSILKPY